MIYIMSNPFITPNKLNLPKIENVKVAFICLCPMPEAFNKYGTHRSVKRHFVHIPPEQVVFCECNSVKFVVVSEVYGYAVTAAVVEELKYHGIDKVIGIGFCGYINDRDEPNNDILGKPFMVSKTNNCYGVANPYTKEKELVADSDLGNILNHNQYCQDIYTDDKSFYEPIYEEAPVYTTLNFYREYEDELKEAVKNGYKIVSMDSVGLFAPQYKLHTEVVYFTVVSDVINLKAPNCDSNLDKNINYLSDESQTNLVFDLVHKLHQLYQID